MDKLEPGIFWIGNDDPEIQRQMDLETEARAKTFAERLELLSKFEPKIVKVTPEDVQAMKALQARLAAVETPGQKVNIIVGDLVDFVRTLTVEDAETLTRDLRRLLEDVIDATKSVNDGYSVHSVELRAEMLERLVQTALLKYGFKTIVQAPAEPEVSETVVEAASTDLSVRVRNLEAQVKKLLEKEEQALTDRMLDAQRIDDKFDRILKAIKGE